LPAIAIAARRPRGRAAQIAREAGFLGDFYLNNGA